VEEFSFKMDYFSAHCELQMFLASDRIKMLLFTVK